MKKAIALVSAVLLLMTLVACGGANWPTQGLGAMLPAPEGGQVKIITDNSENFYVSVDNVPDDAYDKYMDACKEKGFTVDEDNGLLAFTAFNKDGYKLEISGLGTTMYITLDAPVELGTLRWPGGKAGQITPKPESTKGKIEWEQDDSFFAYVGDTTIDQFNDYIDACSKAGFDVDYNRDERNYDAGNEEGYHLTLTYEGFNIMSVEVEKTTDDTATEAAKDSDTSDKASNQSDDKE